LGEVQVPSSKFQVSSSKCQVPSAKCQVPSAKCQVQSSGFTLVELLIVLFVAGVIAAFVVPSFVGGLRGMRLKGEVKHLAATLRFARSQSVCSKGLAVVKLDLDNGTYELTVKERKRRQSQSGLEDDLGLFGGGFGSTSLGGGRLGSASLRSGGSFDGPSSFGGSSAFGTTSDELESEGKKSESPLAQAIKKKRKLKEGVSIASFTYGDETYDDGVCNVFFFPRGTSTGGLIEIMSESGRSFVIEIEPVTGSVKIKSPDDFL